MVLNTVTEFMGSYIHIDSISIDLAESTRKRDAGKCEHFSIRYVGLDATYSYYPTILSRDVGDGSKFVYTAYVCHPLSA